ncbi:hypothetical protein [Pseudovibrio sp. Tun.PSC04-5.I4]|uniref:hypothetical protein n=1 Tax=Pseudovibrio sp. Tun.PSC04-5.I4 TaxID=1798213 RepID=UPI00117B74EB|nr:hypothetical protein [Pseudovibrio sp. Tun.PSC04-5.I4]
MDSSELQQNTSAERNSLSSMERALLDARFNLRSIPRDFASGDPRFGKNSADAGIKYKLTQKLSVLAKEPSLLTPNRAARIGKQLATVSLEAEQPKQALVDYLKGFGKDGTERVVLPQELKDLLSPITNALKRELSERQQDLNQRLDTGRAQSQLRANQAQWADISTTTLTEIAGGKGQRVADEDAAQEDTTPQQNSSYQPTQVTARSAFVEGVHTQGLVGKILGKFPHNVTPLINGAINGREEIFRAEVSTTNGVFYGGLGFTGIYYGLGAIQSLIAARSAYSSMQNAAKAQDTFDGASQQFIAIQDNIAELTFLANVVKDTQKNGTSPLSTIEVVARSIETGKLSKRSLSTTLQSLFPDFSAVGIAASDAYERAAEGSPAERTALANLRGQAALHFGESSTDDAEHLGRALDYLTNTQKRAIRDSHKVHKQLTNLVANYGKDATLAKALHNDYKSQMQKNIFAAGVWGLAIASKAMSTAGRELSSGAQGLSLTTSALGYAAGAAGAGVGVAAVGLEVYNVGVRSAEAYKLHQTGKKADALHHLFSEQVEVPVSDDNGTRKISKPRDAELAQITKTIAGNQLKTRNTKIGQAVLSAIDGFGFAAGTIASVAGIVAVATGAVAAGSVVAAAGPVGAALGGVAVLGMVGFAAFRLIKWGIHHHQSKQLNKVISDDANAIRKYARKHNLDIRESENGRPIENNAHIKEHAIETLTKHSTKFALHRFHQRVKSEIAHVDITHWDHAPSIAVMKCFFNEPAQIQAIASLSDEEAVKVLAKKFQVRM